VQVKLTTTGRRSGEARTVTLYAWPDGDDLVIVGSRGGSAKDPAWAYNLRADPAAIVHHGGSNTDVRAHEVGGAERERLWTLVTEQFRLYATYQRKTTRTIPLFVLEPLDLNPG
jgi:deazaflavin-dependent oxidoreductase (nitroreductase family)